MQGEIIAYLEKRRIPLKTKHLAARFEMEVIDMVPILRVLAANYLIEYKIAQRSERIDWAGWIVKQDRSLFLESLYYDALA